MQQKNVDSWESAERNRIEALLYLKIPLTEKLNTFFVQVDMLWSSRMVEHSVPVSNFQTYAAKMF